MILTKEFLVNDSEELVFYNDLGLSGTQEVIVNWIDKVPPVCDVHYSTTGFTNANVIASLDNCTKTIVITTGTSVYTFTDNGVYTFQFSDLYGNTGSVVANVSWIDKSPVI